MMLSETKQRSHLGSGGRKVKSSWFSCRLQLFKTAALKIWQQTLENTKKSFGWKTKAFLDRISPLRESLEKHEALDPYFKFLSIFPSLSLSLSEAETTFNQLSNAKSLQNICCNRSSVESLLNCRSFFFGLWDQSATVNLWAFIGISESWGGGELPWVGIGDLTNFFLFPNFSSSFSFPCSPFLSVFWHPITWEYKEVKERMKKL